MRRRGDDDLGSVGGSSERPPTADDVNNGESGFAHKGAQGFPFRHWAAFRVVVAVCGAAAMLLGCWAVAKGVDGVIGGDAPLAEGAGGSYASLQSNYGFFAGIYAAVGLAFIAVAFSFRSAHIVLLWLCGVIFLGGVARLVSMALWGAPSLIFLLMIIVELAVPVAVSVWYVWIKKVESNAASTGMGDR